MEQQKQAEHRTTQRRGRRTTPPDPDSGPVGAFADRLWRLKQRAGDPSYEEMSARLGAAASKSSLAAAAQGRSLPSWETTWEFVRVLAVDGLGQDPRATEREWREHWTHAKAGGPAPADETDPPTPAPTATATPAATPAPAVPPRSGGRRRLGIAGLAAATAVLVGAGLTYAALDRRAGGDAGVPPAVAAPADRDDSQFEGDITYPDGSLVPPGSSFTKIWRIRNTGTVAWANRFLVRVNEQPCTAPTMVAIPQTRPGEAVDIAVTVQTPTRPGTCKIYWKMADEQGRMLFPIKRPIFLDVRVGDA